MPEAFIWASEFNWSVSDGAAAAGACRRHGLLGLLRLHLSHLLLHLGHVLLVLHGRRVGLLFGRLVRVLLILMVAHCPGSAGYDGSGGHRANQSPASTHHF